MTTLANPRDALLSELGELLWIERTLAFELLPTVIGEVRDGELKQALEDHLGETRVHASRVESAFRVAGIEAASARSAALAGLKEHHDEQQVTEETLRDLVAASASGRVEHLELALYDSVIGLARQLGLDESADLLEQNRSEEQAALDRVSGVAARLRQELPA